MASITASIQGDIAFTDGSKESFSASLDGEGNIGTDGDPTGFRDSIDQTKQMFLALGGVLTCAVTKTSKVSNDYTVKFEVEATLDDGSKVQFVIERNVKNGNVKSDGANAQYQLAKTHFKPDIQNMIAAIAGASATIS